MTVNIQESLIVINTKYIMIILIINEHKQFILVFVALTKGVLAGFLEKNVDSMMGYFGIRKYSVTQ